MSETLLEIRDLKKHFPLTKGLIQKKVMGWIKAVDGVSFSIHRGETFGLVGESGCGKTTIARLILLLEMPTNGSIMFDGKDIRRLDRAGIKEYRAAVQPVFQDPFSSLSPRMKIAEIIGEPLIVTTSLSREKIRQRVTHLLGEVGLPLGSIEFYPHQFSGGQRQRIAVARALSANPSLVILDEPISALDQSIRAQLMNLLKDLQSKLGLTYLLIAHDLAVVRHMSDTIGVMYLGKIVEKAANDELYNNPMHPYTKMLFSSALPSHPDIQRDEIPVLGEVPSLLNPPHGCRLHPRCPFAKAVCSEVEPPLRDVNRGHQVACHLHS